ncbi:MAG: 2-oxoisovalerate dehydrogenase [Dehalococcoidia bacterium]
MNGPEKELIFIVTDAEEGGLLARALGEAIFTEADDMDSLRAMIRDAVACHFDDGEAPRVVRLHYVRDEVLAL